MKNPRILFGILALTLLSAGALAGYLHATFNHGEQLDIGIYPEGLAVRAELHEGEVVRNVELYPDGITPRRGIAEHIDGSVTTYTYRENGTLESARTEGPADQNGERQLIRYAEIAIDGATYVSDVEYTAHGLKRKETRLTDENTSVRRYFFEDGSTRKHQVIVREPRGWKLSIEDVFREDGTLAHTLRPLPNFGWVEQDFADNGITVLASRTLRAMGTEYIEAKFSADGKVKLTETVQDSDRTTITSRRADGSLSHERIWQGEVNKTSMHVNFFGAGTNRVFDQWWDLKEGKYVLWMLREYRADGTQSRQILFEQTGTRVVVELVYPGDGRMGASNTYLRRKYRADGTLETEEEVVDGKVRTERKFSAEANVRVQVDPKHIEPSAYEVPPQMVPFSPPRPF